jgi:hypothetical protein
MQSHYPERVVRIVVVNVPFFLGSVWKAIASVLPKSVQERIELSSDASRDLSKYISLDTIPACYKGHSQLDFGNSVEERELRAVVERANGRASGRDGMERARLGQPSTLVLPNRTEAVPPVAGVAAIPLTPSAPARPLVPQTALSASKRWRLFGGFSASKPKQVGGPSSLGHKPGS